MPEAYVPLYDLVSFTTVPYAAARERARRQDRAVRKAAVAVAIAVVSALGVSLYLAARRIMSDG
jgi:kynurenine 3-monooxygenase